MADQHPHAKSSSAFSLRPRWNAISFLALSSLVVYLGALLVIFDGNRRFSTTTGFAFMDLASARVGLDSSVLVVTSIYWIGLAYEIHQSAWATTLRTTPGLRRMRMRRPSTLAGISLRSILLALGVLVGWAALSISIMIAAATGNHWAAEGVSGHTTWLFASCVSILLGTTWQVWTLGVLAALEHGSELYPRTKHSDWELWNDEKSVIIV